MVPGRGMVQKYLCGGCAEHADGSLPFDPEAVARHHGEASLIPPNVGPASVRRVEQVALHLGALGGVEL